MNSMPSRKASSSELLEPTAHSGFSEQWIPSQRRCSTKPDSPGDIAGDIHCLPRSPWAFSVHRHVGVSGTKLQGMGDGKFAREVQDLDDVEGSITRVFKYRTHFGTIWQGVCDLQRQRESMKLASLNLLSNVRGPTELGHPGVDIEDIIVVTLVPSVRRQASARKVWRQMGSSMPSASTRPHWGTDSES